MRTLLRRWRAIEPWLGCAAVAVEWEERFGVDADVLCRHLRPTGMTSKTYPCFRPGGRGCPRQVHHRGGVYDAVCANLPAECEPVRLEKTQLTALALDVQQALAPMVAATCAEELLEPVAFGGLEGLLPVGVLARRVGRVLVVLATPEGAANRGAVLHLRHRARAEGVAVIVDDARVDIVADDRVVELAMGDPGNLRLWRALRLLWPESWAERAGRKEAILEDVRLELASGVGRHVVRLNGVELKHFRYSDAKLARLLVLAAARQADLDVEGGGWLKKRPALQLDEREGELVEFRKAVVEQPGGLAGLTEAERKALLQSSVDRPGLLRLALHPRNIHLDESLRGFQLLGERQTAPRVRAGGGRTREAQGGGLELARNQGQARTRVLGMLAEARRLGVPLPGEAELGG